MFSGADPEGHIVRRVISEAKSLSFDECEDIADFIEWTWEVWSLEHCPAHAEYLFIELWVDKVTVITIVMAQLLFEYTVSVSSAVMSRKECGCYRMFWDPRRMTRRRMESGCWWEQDKACLEEDDVSVWWLLWWLMLNLTQAGVIWVEGIYQKMPYQIAL